MGDIFSSTYVVKYVFGLYETSSGRHLGLVDLATLYLATLIGVRMEMSEKKSKMNGKGKARRQGIPHPFNKKLQGDTALVDVIGITKVTRAQIVKRIWRYVKRHKLQDPKEGQ